MNEKEVRERAFAMPLISPVYPPGPYRFINRELLIIACRTDPDALRAVIAAPLEFTDPIVKYELIRMPDRTSTASRPVSWCATSAATSPCMAPGPGRPLWNCSTTP